MSTATKSTETEESIVTKTERMFRKATQGDILVLNVKKKEERYEILSVGKDTIGKTITINYKEKEKEKETQIETEKEIKSILYFNETYQTLQRFVPGYGMDTLPGSKHFRVIEPEKTVAKK